MKKYYSWLFYGIVLAAGAVIFLLNFFQPPSPSAERLGLYSWRLTAVLVTLQIPYTAVWFLGVRAAAGLYFCRDITKNTLLARACGRFAAGVVLLVAGMVIGSLFGPLKNYYRQNQDAVVLLTIASNYTGVYLSLAGFLALFSGTKALMVDPQKKTTDTDFVSFIITLFLGVIYTILVFTNPQRQTSPLPGIPATYYLPDLLIFSTIIIPILVTWFFGVRTAYALSRPKVVTGVAGSALALLGSSILFVIFASILLQFLISLGMQRFITLGVGPTLILLYAFIVLVAIGYIMLNRAVRGLKEAL